jgi:hypothetical protein
MHTSNAFGHRTSHRGFDEDNFAYHLIFKLGPSLTKMSLSMIVGAQRNDISHSICPIVGESNDMMTF